MQRVFLLLGSNLGDRADNLAVAKKLLGESIMIDKESSLYESAPWGVLNQPHFYNQVVSFLFHDKPETLLRITQSVEMELGRVRKEKWGPRLIDLDILLFGDLSVDQPNLKIPHPYLPNRKFALVPLAELNESLQHPILHKSIRQLLDECEDTLRVNRLPIL